MMEIKNITFNYTDNREQIFRPVFEGFNLTIKQGEIISILGPSGCGKSTFIQLLAGHLKPKSGEIHSFHQPPSHVNNRRVVLHQEDDLFPWMTILEQLRIGKESLTQDEARMWLEHVDLNIHLSDRTSLLSGGMKKRLSLIRALISKPEILLMDEAFSSLDVHTKKQLLPFVAKTIKEQQQTALFVTHDLEEAIFLGDRIILLQGSPAQIVFDKQSPFDITKSEQGLSDPEFLKFKNQIQEFFRSEHTVSDRTK